MNRRSAYLIFLILLGNLLVMTVFGARNGWERLNAALAVALLIGGGLRMVRGSWGGKAAFLGAAFSALLPAVYLVLHEPIGFLRETFFGAEVPRFGDLITPIFLGLVYGMPAVWHLIIGNGVLFGVYGMLLKREHARTGGEKA